MTRTLTECPTCHEHIPFVWHGHHAVSSGHPEDDDPWCTHCGRPLNDMRSNNPADYCTKAAAAAEETDREAFALRECPRCADHGIITVATSGPDTFGNYDTDEVLCPEHETRYYRTDNDDDYHPPMPGAWEFLP